MSETPESLSPMHCPRCGKLTVYECDAREFDLSGQPIDDTDLYLLCHPGINPLRPHGCGTRWATPTEFSLDQAIGE